MILSLLSAFSIAGWAGNTEKEMEKAVVLQ